MTSESLALILGFTEQQLKARSALWTAREIAQQPRVWQMTAALLQSQQAAVRAFLAPLLERDDLRIVLTGAGSSAFIGACLAPLLRRRKRWRVDAIATTDIVSGPQQYLQVGLPTLLVSFARSGNSPESVAAINLAEQCVAPCWHLIVTCNRDGAVHRRAQAMKNAFSIVLPDETHDRGFAMTSSFSSMLLAAAMIFSLLPGDEPLARLVRAGEAMLLKATSLVNALTALKFERVIYLGSNGLQAIAQESALKMLELTDGGVVAMHDSSLGFRHGPKTCVNDKTLVVLLSSVDPYTRQYDLDLLRELGRDRRAAAIVAISHDISQDVSNEPVLAEGLVHNLTLAEYGVRDDLEVALLAVMFAQINGLCHSLQRGLTPDNPNSAGIVNRVVQGVAVYPYAANRHLTE